MNNYKITGEAIRKEDKPFFFPVWLNFGCFRRKSFKNKAKDKIEYLIKASPPQKKRKNVCPFHLHLVKIYLEEQRSLLAKVIFPSNLVHNSLSSVLSLYSPTPNQPSCVLPSFVSHSAMYSHNPTVQYLLLCTSF